MAAAQVPVLYISSYDYTVPYSFIVDDLQQAFHDITTYCQVRPYSFAQAPPCPSFALEPVDRLGVEQAWRNRAELENKINQALAIRSWSFNQFYIHAPDGCDINRLIHYLCQIPGAKQFMTNGGAKEDPINL